MGLLPPEIESPCYFGHICKELNADSNWTHIRLLRYKFVVFLVIVVKNGQKDHFLEILKKIKILDMRPV